MQSASLHHHFLSKSRGVAVPRSKMLLCTTTPVFSQLLRRAPPAAASAAARRRGFHTSLALNLLAKGEKLIKVLPTQVVLAAYNRLDGADDAVNKLKEALKKDLEGGGGDTVMTCKNIAVIKKPFDGKLQITETGKIKKSHGAAVGAFLSGASVLLLGPVTVAAGALGGALAGMVAKAGARVGATFGAAAAAQGTLLAHIVCSTAGAATGAYAAAKTETLDPDKLNELADLLQPNNSAIVVVFDQVVMPMKNLDAEMKAARDEVLYKVGKDIGAALERGDDAAVMIAFTEDKDVVNTRMATGDDANDIKGLIIEGEAIDEDPEAGPEEVVKYEVIDSKIVDDTTEKQK